MRQKAPVWKKLAPNTAHVIKSTFRYSRTSAIIYRCLNFDCNLIVFRNE